MLVAMFIGMVLSVVGPVYDITGNITISMQHFLWFIMPMAFVVFIDLGCDQVTELIQRGPKT